MLLARHAIVFGTVALAAAGPILLAGCTMVGDTLTGLSAVRAGPSQCLKACIQSHDELVQAEAGLHQSRIRACQQVPERQRGECVAAEAARHGAAMARISAGRRECMNQCHHQGSGSAG